MKSWRLLLLVVVVNTASAMEKVTSLPRETSKHKKLHIPAGIDTTDEIHTYIVEVLKRALDHTNSQYGPATLNMQREAMVQTRQVLNLEKGMADVIWMVSDANRDARAMSVPIPIIGGLYGLRVLMIRKSDSRFTQTLSLATLKKLSLTQANDWPDTQILRSNNFTVIGNPYLAGFRAVSKHYVDAYPRALHEAALELNSDVAKELMLDRHHLLFYPNPLFFYVNKNNLALAQRIEEGLILMIESGELQSLLAETAFYQRAKQAFKGRTVYTLKNRRLSENALEAFSNYLVGESLPEYAKKEHRQKMTQ